MIIKKSILCLSKFDMGINTIKGQIKKNYEVFREIQSAYIYGSVLTDRFKTGKSDVDVLFICKDIKTPFTFLKKLKKTTKKLVLLI